MTSLPKTAGAADALTPAKKKEAREHFFTGSRKYDLGRYDEASEEFQKAYEILGDPMILYNVAKSLQYAKNIEKALFFYKRYLARSATAPNRSEVETRIVELTAAMDKVTQSDRIPPTGIIRQNDPSETEVDKTPDKTEKTTDKTSEKVVVAPKVDEPPPVTPRQRLARGLGFGLIGLVVGGIATGAAMLSLSSTRSTDFQTRANAGGLTYDDPSLLNYESRSKTYGNAGIACLAIGGAAAIGAGVALFFGYRKGHETAPAKSAQILPFFSPSSGGMLVQGQF